MKRILFTAAAFAAVHAAAATSAEAQGRATQCASSTSPTNAAYYTADACEKAIDLFNYMAPQLGTAIAGGSPVIGKGGVLGGLPHFSVGLRVNAVRGSLPQVAEADVTPAPGGAQQDNYQTEEAFLPMPVADVALGIFKGIPLGVTRVGGIDLLANVAYMQDYDGDDVSVSVGDDGNFKFGYGARIGLLQESLVSPGVAVSWIKRDLPVVNIAGNLDGYDVQVNDLDVQTTAWRVTASKSFLIFGLIAGAGQDTYESSATVVGTYRGSVAGLVDPSATITPDVQKLTRTNFFGGLTMNIALVRLGLEVGQVSGGEVQTFNTFDKKPDASRLYGSFGIRVGI